MSSQNMFIDIEIPKSRVMCVCVYKLTPHQIVVFKTTKKNQRILNQYKPFRFCREVTIFLRFSK